MRTHAWVPSSFRDMGYNGVYVHFLVHINRVATRVNNDQKYLLKRCDLMSCLSNSYI